MRAAGSLAAAAGAALAVLPALPWYAVEAPDVQRRASGLAGSGELWILPLLGAVAVAVGALVALGGSRDPGRRRVYGLVLVALAFLAAFWCVRGMVDPPVRLVLAGSPDAVPAPIALEPAAFAALPAAAALALAGLAAARRPEGAERTAPRGPA